MNKRRALAAPFLVTFALSPVALADATPPSKKLPQPRPGATVQRHEDGTCWQMPEMGHCPPGAFCNPGPPSQVECPPEKPKK